MKKYYIESLGCAKNQVDSELLMARLRDEGWMLAECADADAIIVNSCGFIESAKRESINTVLEFRKQFPAKKIILAGCLAVRYPDELREALTEADIVCPSSDAERITALVAGEGRGLGGGAPRQGGSGEAALRSEGGFPPFSQTVSKDGERPLLSLPGSAYIKIAEGCDNRCAFCAIPLIRGPLHSRNIASIAAECNALLKRGVRELCLIAQDSAAFGSDRGRKSMLPALLETLLEAKGDYWLRLLYLHPDHFPVEILPLAQNDERLLPYFDIPFQHASKNILQAMNRHGDKEKYLALIDTIRAALPDATLRSTFLVGFPGETDEDFDDLLDFQLQAGLDWAGVFTYSPEEGTPAAAYRPRPSKKTAAERKARLEAAQTAITCERLARHLNKKLACLVEEEIDGEEGLYLGRAWLNAPEVDGAVVIDSDKRLTAGDFAEGIITGQAGFDLRMNVD
jgi:ribosomal protein S12 methylthiotransferase